MIQGRATPVQDADTALAGTVLRKDGPMPRRLAGLVQSAAASAQVQRLNTIRTGNGASAAPVQRVINLSATQYASHFAAPLTLAQLKDYLAIAVRDDFKLALDYADALTRPVVAGVAAGAKERATMIALWTTANGALAAGGIAVNIAAADTLMGIVNGVLAAGVNKSNAETRYASEPAAGYEHTSASPTWAAAYAGAAGNAAAKKAAADTAHPEVTWESEADGQQAFTAAAAGALAAAPTVASRTTTEDGAARPLIKQLTWAQARDLLPRPVLNLMFDARYQLVTPVAPAGGGAPVGAPFIDERSATERTARKTTPKEPGTLRSWHEDSKGRLPDNNVSTLAAGAVAGAIPASGQALHTHYAATSASGSGSAAGAATQPLGFAEYTGAGASNIHDIKIVLDYVNGRLFLTMSHYQYWGVWNDGGVNKFVTAKTQNMAATKAEFEQKKYGGYIMMSPWIEILMP